jgi:phosphohistidine phosphatase
LIYLFRHGIADFEEEGTGIKIEDPGLNSDGIWQVKKTCESGIKLGINPARIFTSPLLRAKETAEICKLYGWGQSGLFISEKLLPDSNPEELVDKIRQDQVKDDVVLVSHYPILGKLSEKILSKELGFYIRNGALLGIDLEDSESLKGEVSVYLS